MFFKESDQTVKVRDNLIGMCKLGIKLLIGIVTGDFSQYGDYTKTREHHEEEH